MDSELALVRQKEYPLAGWVENPYYLGNQNRKLMVSRQNVLMVSRLDGPTPAVVKRIVDDSLLLDGDLDPAECYLASTRFGPGKWC